MSSLSPWRHKISILGILGEKNHPRHLILNTDILFHMFFFVGNFTKIDVVKNKAKEMFFAILMIVHHDYCIQMLLVLKMIYIHISIIQIN